MEKERILSLILSPYFQTSFLFLWLLVLTIAVSVRKRKTKRYRQRNDLEHRQLMKNQNTLNTLVRKLTILLKEDLEQSRTLKATVVQRIVPFVRDDTETKKLLKEIERLENLKKEVIDQLAEKSREIDALNRKYRKVKEELELERTTVKIEKLM